MSAHTQARIEVRGRRAARRWLSSRVAGVACVLGAAVLLVDALLILGNPPEGGPYVSRIVTASSLGALAGAVGLAFGYLGLVLLGACGPDPAERRVPWLPVLGILISRVGWAVDPVGGGFAVLGDLVQLAGEVGVAILVLRAGVWQGWRRFTPLGILAAIPVGVGLVLATDRLGSAVVVGAVATLVMGVAVASTRPVARWGDRPASSPDQPRPSPPDERGLPSAVG